MPAQSNSPFKTQPFAHQARALEVWKGKRRFALLCEMGTGKTWIGINHAAELFRQGEARRFLILAPRSLLGVWAAELEKHCPVPYRALILDKPRDWARLPERPKDRALFAIANYDKLITKRFDALMNGGFDMALLDESTMVKNYTAKRSKKAKILCDRIPQVAIMTGNATPNGPLDLWWQFMILDPKILGLTNYYAFRNRYAIMGGFRIHGKPVQVVGYREELIEQEIKPRMAPYVFQALKKDCLDLPPKVYARREITMGKEQAKVYKELREKSVTEFKGQFLQAPIVVARLTRLSQIAGGFFPTDQGGQAFTPNPKLDELERVMDEAGGKVIIWCRFRAELHAIGVRLTERKIAYVGFHGDLSQPDRQQAIEAFQNDPTCRAFVGITSCGKFGLTLTAATTVIYFSNSYAYEDRSQSEDRAHRAGQTKTVTYVDLVAKGTADDLILKCLQSKKSISEFIQGLSVEEVF